MSWKSPIDVIYQEVEHSFEGGVFKAIQKADITVDREELIAALHYDRGQYEKGYADGKRDAWNEVVRCKDCLMHGVCRFEQGLGLDGYCSQAERKEE